MRSQKAIAVLAVGGAMLAFAGPASALSRPSVSTGSAHQVSFSSAVLSGSVNPNGADTSYYFQYGHTRAYLAQSAIADAGAGTHSVKVSLPVAGLQPLTLYHFRLVAVNAAGVTLGPDATFLTTKVPLSLQIFASPNPVLFGGTVVVQGTLSGTNNAGRQVILQANPWPFAGFQSIGEPHVTTATGTFSFPVLGLGLVTQFRVVTATNPPVISPPTSVGVAVQVTSHVGGTHRRHFVRIYGVVTPAEDGAQVGILRIAHGRGILVGGATLHHRSPSTSKFSRVVRVSRGVYRVLVRVTNGAQISNYGRPLAIG